MAVMTAMTVMMTKMMINLSLSNKCVSLWFNMDDSDDDDGDDDEEVEDGNDSDDDGDDQPLAQQQVCFSLNRSALELRKGSPPPPQSESFY